MSFFLRFVARRPFLTSRRELGSSTLLVLLSIKSYDLELIHLPDNFRPEELFASRKMSPPHSSLDTSEDTLVS